MAKLELQGQIPFFLQSFLSQPATSLPKGGQWVLVFEGSEDGYGGGVNDQIIPVQAIIKGTKYEPKNWDIESAIATTLYTDYQEKKGCMFVQAVQIPGESNQVNPEGLQQSGYIRSFTGAGRDPFQNLSISFLETNISFADNVIRPWVIATSHLGMIARSGALNYRCNISIYKIAVLDELTAPYVAQKYTFFGACPVSISGEEYNYTQVTAPVNREASFTYHYYSIETDRTNLAISAQKRELLARQATAQANINAYSRNIAILRTTGRTARQRAQNIQRAQALQLRLNSETGILNNIRAELQRQTGISNL
jgi:hypothetical protein